MTVIFGKTRSNPKYLLDFLILFGWESSSLYTCDTIYVVSITWYINQPLVRLLLHIINPQLVWYHLHRFILCNDPIPFLVRMFSFKLEYISPYSVSTRGSPQVDKGQERTYSASENLWQIGVIALSKWSQQRLHYDSRVAWDSEDKGWCSKALARTQVCKTKLGGYKWVSSYLYTKSTMGVIMSQWSKMRS